MPNVPINIPPGVVKVDSAYAAKGRWIDMDKVRFVRGRPEKVGGVQKFILDQYDGTVRGAEAWATNTGIPCLVFGTACDLYLFRENALSKITPYRIGAEAIALTDPFTTTSGSSLVEVTDAGHGITDTGIEVSFSGASAVGGITIDGTYEVTEVIDVDTFSISHTSAATSSATGGGSVTASYTLNCGDVDPTYLLGWGIGGWGEGYWGTSRSIASAQLSEPLVWSMSNYGEDLIVNPLNDGLFLYDASGGISRAARIANSPAQNRAVFVTPERYIMALGCTNLSGTQDPMNVRWADVEDNTDWTPSSTNTANERRLQGGTRLINGVGLTDGVSVVWSDSALFVFQFTGSSLVYDSRKIADNCGLIGKLAYASSGGMAFWMSENNFWMYAGYVQPIQNVEDVREWVFRQINQSHAIKSFAFYNPRFNEVWFVFPVGTSTEPNVYVAVDLDDFSWSHGTWGRTTAATYKTGERRPIMFGTDGYVYVHDVIENPDNDGDALPAYITVAPFDIDGGNRLLDVFGFIPDFQRQSGDMTLHMYGVDHPRDGVVLEETVTVAESSSLVDIKIAGRQAGFTLTSNALGGDFRLGALQLEISGAGRRR